MNPIKRIAQVALCLAAAIAIGLIAFTITRSRATPTGPFKFNSASADSQQLILWAWERPTDLRFIDKHKVGVAFLAKSVFLKNDEVQARPRLQSLQLEPGTKLIAVTRIETDGEHRPTFSANQRQAVAQAITDTASLPNISEIQIDFDATKSERNFYRELIADVRHSLPQHVRLSITALASWCMHDDWISDLPIDEAVPMLFRMTNDGRQIVNRLDAGDDFNAAPCRQSYGLSLDEKRPRLIPARRLFVFNPNAWMEESVRQIPESTK